MLPVPLPAFKNGMGMYVPAIKRVVLEYCERSGSSAGMIEFLTKGKHLERFAAAHPHVEVVVTPRPAKHPLVTGVYMSGRSKPLCVKNLGPHDIAERLALLTQAADAGSKSPAKGGVISSTPAVRGIWSPFVPTKKLRLKH